MKAINVVVIGATGSGKSHVLQVLNDALKSAYGPHAQVCSHALSAEQAMGSPGSAPVVSETVFVLSEQNMPRESMAMNIEGLKNYILGEQPAEVQALEALPDGYALESAIRNAAEAAKGQEGLALTVLERHLKSLCDLQLEQLKA